MIINWKTQKPQSKLEWNKKLVSAISYSKRILPSIIKFITTLLKRTNSTNTNEKKQENSCNCKPMHFINIRKMPYKKLKTELILSLENSALAALELNGCLNVVLNAVNDNG